MNEQGSVGPRNGAPRTGRSAEAAAGWRGSPAPPKKKTLAETAPVKRVQRLLHAVLDGVDV